MKTVKCPECKREKEVESDVIISLCRCGHLIDLTEDEINKINEEINIEIENEEE